MNMYKAVKNLIVNDMRISREDIKAIIEKTMQVEINKWVESPAFTERIDNIILGIVKANLQAIQRNGFEQGLWNITTTNTNEFVRRRIADIMAKQISDTFDISVTVKNNKEA